MRRYHNDFHLWLRERLAIMPRGTAFALADACEVARSTVTHWGNGTNTPIPRHWRTIEDFFEVPHGTIAEIVGYEI